MKKVVERCTCDRCGSVVNEEEVAEESLSVDGLPRVLLSVRGTLLGKAKGVDSDPMEFSDLCEKCTSRVVSLIEDIAKTGKGRGRPRGSKAPSAGGKKKNKGQNSSAAATTVSAPPA